MKPLVIGLSGKSGSGKSTAADYLWDKHYYHRFAFADTLKALVGQAFNFSQEQLYGDLKGVLDPRFGKSPRWCLQYIGTDVFRSIWPQIWIWHLLESIRDFWQINGQKPVVVTDVRFRDEFWAVKGLGGILVRIEREEKLRVSDLWDFGIAAPLAAGTPGHLSEIQLDAWYGWDHVVHNNGGLGALCFQLDCIVNTEGKGP